VPASQGSETTTEVVRRKGLTPLAIALIVILSIPMFYVNYHMWWRRGITLEPFFGGRIGAPIYLPFGFIWLLAVIAAITKKISIPEIVVVVGSLYFIMDVGFYSFFLEPLTYSYHAQTIPDIAKLLDYVPSIWAPKDPRLVERIFTGGGAIPGAIMPSLILASFVMLSLFLLNLFTGVVLKDQFVEVERLVFPAVAPAAEPLKAAETSTLTSFARQRLFYIGFIIGLLIAIQSTLNYIYPVFPVFFAWGQIYLTAWDAFLKSINPSIMDWWMFIPVDMLLFYLAPIDVTASVAIWTGFKSIIWPLIAVGTGLIAAGQHPDAGPIKLGSFCLWATLALGVYTVLFKYDLWVGYLKKLVGSVKETVSPGKLPARMALLGLIASYLLYLIIFAALGAHVGYLILFQILWFFTLVGMARVWAETGQWAGAAAPYAAQWITVSIAYAAGVPNPWPSTTWWATKAAMRPTFHIPQATFSAWAAVSTYKLASETKTDERSLLIGQIIAIVLASFIGLYLGLSMLYAAGADNVFTRTWYVKARPADVVRNREVPGVINPESVMDSVQVTHLIAAFVIVGLLWFLRSRFTWWWFVPVALYFYSGMWFLSSLPALLLKLLTVRVFGVKFYEEKAVPFVIGVIVGISFGAFVFGSIAALV